MDISSTLDIISKEKIHHFVGLLPIVTFIFFKVNFWVIISYTVIFVIWEVYIHSLTAFKKRATQTVLNPPKLEKTQNKKINLKNLKIMFAFFNKNLDYIPYWPLFIVIMLIFLCGFIYSFFLSIKYLDQNIIYNLILFLAHIFLAVFILTLYVFLQYYRRLISKRKEQ
jgi:hypothetical protein